MSNYISIVLLGICAVVVLILKPKWNFYLLVLMCFGLSISTILSLRVNIIVPINILDALVVTLIAGYILDTKRQKADITPAIDKYRLLEMLFILLSVLAAIIGVLNGNSTLYLLKDLRVFLYFVIIYYYTKNTVREWDDLRKLINIFLISAVMVSFQQIYTYYSKAASSELLDLSVRNISLPLTTSVLAVLLMIGYAKDWPIFKNKIIYYLLTTLFIATCVISLTRSIWMMLAFTIIAFFILVKKDFNYSIKFFISLGAVFTIIIITAWMVDSRITDLLVTRLNSTTTAFANESDTLFGRFYDSASAWKQIGIGGIILGKGFGTFVYHFDPYTNASYEITALENSFLHYSWKLGVIGAISVFSLFISKIRNIYVLYKKYIQTENANVYLIFFCFCLVSFFIGIWSQGINIAYVMPGWAVLLGIDYESIIKSNNNMECKK